MTCRSTARTCSDLAAKRMPLQDARWAMTQRGFSRNQQKSKCFGSRTLRVVAGAFSMAGSSLDRPTSSNFNGTKRWPNLEQSR